MTAIELENFWFALKPIKMWIYFKLKFCVFYIILICMLIKKTLKTIQAPIYKMAKRSIKPLHVAARRRGWREPGNSIKDPTMTRTGIGFLVLLLYENT